ncbi:hypothetical protein FCI58_14520, partial [Enterobacter hormaechei]|nr:hypothetical protein [Enterobacter hormaechei]
VIVALNIAAMSEALTLATKAGVNPDLVYQAIRGGLAGSMAPVLPIRQSAATLWYHANTPNRTAQQVYNGLAGMWLVEDEVSKSLPIPNHYGVDDFPIIIQDKRLDNFGTPEYSEPGSGGFVGDTLLVNGAQSPYVEVSRGWVRLRLLNGCNARSLNFAASDKRPLYVVASDGGLLPEPVKVSELPMLMGERFEVLVDISDGKPFDLVTLPVSQMGMAVAPFDKPHPVLRIQPLLVAASGTLPDTLTTLPALPSLEGLTQRRLQLSMNPMLDMMGMQALMAKYGDKAMAGMHHGQMMGHMNMD